MALVEWGQGERAQVETAAELDALLDRVADEARAMGKPQDVQVTVASAGTLGIVVGGDRSLLNHIPADSDPPYLVSVGGQGGEDPFVFYVAGDHYSESLCRNTIPMELARVAMRHFFTTGSLTHEVEWEQV
jgi:hypothetical protein